MCKANETFFLILFLGYHQYLVVLMRVYFEINGTGDQKEISNLFFSFFFFKNSKSVTKGNSLELILPPLFNCSEQVPEITPRVQGTIQ